MARDRGDFMKIYTAADLGLAIADTSGTPTITGSFVDIADFDIFGFYLSCSSGSVAGHVRFRGKDGAGTSWPIFPPLRGTSAYPFVFGGQLFITCDPTGGNFQGIDATQPTFAANFACLDEVQFQVQITTGAVGTATASLYCKRRPVMRVG